MKAAIYVRKSKDTDTGDSIENQIQLCKNQLQFYGIKEYEIYEDYAQSGGTMDRPEFKKMISEIKKGNYTHLICYKLDRIARSVVGFSSLFEDLNSYDVAFISVKEQFDTSTPMGRAMMYMLSVFAQFERETISERVLDSMVEMAKRGLFLAGQAPVGYKRERVENAKNKSYTRLILDEDYKHIPKLIYDKYFEIGSKSGVRRWLADNGYQTKRGALYGDMAIRTILDSFQYLEATTESKDYLESLGYTVFNTNLLDKGYAYLHYNKKPIGKTRLKDIEDQVIAVSTHPALITLEYYKKAKILNKKNQKRTNKGKQIKASLLTGIMRCSKCGRAYVISHGRNKKYYRCWTKQKYSSSYCDSKSFPAEDLEELVINTLKKLFSDTDQFLKELKKASKDVNNVKDNINKKIENLNLELINLSRAIAKTNNNDLLIEQYNLKQEEIERLEVQKNRKLNETENNTIIEKSISNFVNLIDDLDLVQKRMLLQDVVKEIRYDHEKENLIIELYNIGSKDGREIVALVSNDHRDRDSFLL